MAVRAVKKLASTLRSAAASSTFSRFYGRKKPISVTVISKYNDAPITYTLSRTNMESRDKDYFGFRYCIKRKDIAAALQKKATGVYISYLHSSDEDTISEYKAVQFLPDGVRVGCQLITADTVKVIKKWAGV